MTTSMNLNSTYRRRENSNTRVVPAAAVWEPNSSVTRQGSASHVRTLAPHSVRTLGGAPAATQQDSLSNAREQRREHRRTYLMGAMLGFAIVGGSLHLLAQEDPATSVGYVDTITADVAK